MSLKIVDGESQRKKGDDNLEELVIREYNENEKEKEEVEEMERQCEFGEEEGKPSLITHLLSDPLGRIPHFPISVMMVAEYQGKIVGVVRGGVKTVTRGKKIDDLPDYVKLAYILGLRVSPMHRKLCTNLNLMYNWQKGIATKLIKRLEEWCKEKGSEYVYMMTDCGNEASINLFTHKLNYSKFCNPTVLVQPVHAHRKSINSNTAIVFVPPPVAESMYRKIFSNSELFPKDIESVLSSTLHLGTFIAMPKKYLKKWDPINGLPPCYAMTSVWNTNEVYQLQLTGVSKITKACCLVSRVLDAQMPWLGVPSIPDMFNPFGFYFLYGLHMEGKGCLDMMKSLCNFAHNMARDDVACAAVVAEVAQWDPVSEAIPHWKRFSWSEDLWYMKKFPAKGGDEEPQLLDWNTFPSSSTVFVDPRDF